MALDSFPVDFTRSRRIPGARLLLLRNFPQPQIQIQHIVSLPTPVYVYSITLFLYRILEVFSIPVSPITELPTSIFESSH